MGKTFETLNGIRGLAAVFVVVLHSSGLIGFSATPGGHLAVDLFFVLSAFVIAHAYESRLAGGLTTLGFLRLRLIRFYPLYFLGLCLGAAAMITRIAMARPDAMTPSDTASAIALGLFFLPAPQNGVLDPLNLPAWSLQYELLINVFYAAVLRRLSGSALFMVASASLACIAWLAISEGRGVSFGPTAAEWLGASLRTVFSFSIGLMIYRGRRSVPALRVSAVVIAVAAVAPMLISVSDAVRPVFDLLVIGLWFPAAIALASRVEPIRGAAMLRFLGVASFGLYAIHYPIIQTLLALNQRTGISGPIVAALVIAGLVVAAGIIAARYDEPARALLSRQVPGRQVRNV